MGGFLWNWETSSKLASNLTFKQAFGCTHSHKPYASYALRPKVSVFNWVSKSLWAYWMNPLQPWNNLCMKYCSNKYPTMLQTKTFIHRLICYQSHWIGPSFWKFRQPPLFKTISSFLTPFLVRLPFGILFWSFDPCNYIIFCKNIEKSKFDLEVMMTSTSGSLKKLKTRHLMVSTNKPLQIAPLLNLKSAF